MKNRIVCIVLLALLIAPVPIGAQAAEWILSETQEFSLANEIFSMAYPAGWFAARNRTAIAINELETDHTAAFEGPFATEGYSIQFDTARIASLKREGLLSDEPTLDELWLAMMTMHAYREASETREIVLFDAPALQVLTVDGQGDAVAVTVGFVGTNAYHLSLSAPSDEALAAFMSTWQIMLDSVRRTAGRQNIGDYSLNFICMGEGTPTVILEAGWGGSGTEAWSRVQNGVVEFTRVCSYDRLNIGMSDSVELEERRSGQEVAADLHALLAAAQIEGPYVLVGHSLGGALVRLYADQYPDDVVGMVLADASHEDVPQTREDILGTELFEEDLAMMYDFISEPLDFLGILEDVGETGDLGDMPLVVLTARLYEVHAPYTEETAQQEHDAWVDVLQPQLAELSTNSTHIIVEDGGHLFPRFLPQYVIDAIHSVVEEVRNE